MARQQTGPMSPQIPEGLAGTWTGQDGDGLLFMTLEADGRVIIAYDGQDTAPHTGTFTVTGNTFLAELPDGAKLSLKFLLTGNTLIFAGEGQWDTLNLARHHFPGRD